MQRGEEAGVEAAGGVGEGAVGQEHNQVGHGEGDEHPPQVRAGTGRRGESAGEDDAGGDHQEGEQQSDGRLGPRDQPPGQGAGGLAQVLPAKHVEDDGAIARPPAAGPRQPGGHGRHGEGAEKPGRHPSPTPRQPHDAGQHQGDADVAGEKRGADQSGGAGQQSRRWPVEVGGQDDQSAHAQQDEQRLGQGRRGVGKEVDGGDGQD